MRNLTFLCLSSHNPPKSTQINFVFSPFPVVFSIFFSIFYGSCTFVGRWVVGWLCQWVVGRQEVTHERRRGGHNKFFGHIENNSDSGASASVLQVPLLWLSLGLMAFCFGRIPRGPFTQCEMTKDKVRV